MSKYVDNRNLLSRAHDKKLCFIVKTRTEMVKKVYYRPIKGL